MKLDHIAIWVKDLEHMASFYEKFFGGHRNEKYHNPNTGMSSYFISFRGSTRLELMHHKDLSDNLNGGKHLGITHIAFSLDERSEVDYRAQLFRQEGIPILRGPRKTGDGYYEFETRDPEGNRLEVMSR